MKNYLPFIRRESLTLEPNIGSKVLIGPLAATSLTRLATGGGYRAVIQDLVIFEGDEDTNPSIPNTGHGGMIKVRIGIDGRGFFTEHLYDYRVYQDKTRSLWSVWDWSMGGRYPYRLYPGQHMLVELGAPADSDMDTRAVMFNGLQYDSQDKAEPIMLYGMEYSASSGSETDLWSVSTRRLQCPSTGPVDLYSITTSSFEFKGSGTNLPGTQPVVVRDGFERLFWERRPTWGFMIDPPSSPISLGAEGWVLDPDESVVVQARNGNPSASTQTLTICVRGVLEVEDGR